MSGVDRPALNWYVPADLWDAFTGKVTDKWGSQRLYGGIEIERAWREYRDEHALEAHVDRLLTAAALPADGDRNKKSVKSYDSSDKVQASVRVHEDVKSEMAAHAAEHGTAKGKVLAAVLRWYLNGGRDAIVTRKLSRATPAIEDALRYVKGGAGMTVVERRTMAVCEEIQDEIESGLLWLDDIHGAIKDVVGDSLPTLEKYTGRVLDRTGFVPDPTTPKGYVSQELQRELANEVFEDALPRHRDQLKKARAKRGFTHPSRDEEDVEAALKEAINASDWRMNDRGTALVPPTSESDGPVPNDDTNTADAEAEAEMAELERAEPVAVSGG